MEGKEEEGWHFIRLMQQCLYVNVFVCISLSGDDTRIPWL